LCWFLCAVELLMMIVFQPFLMRLPKTDHSLSKLLVEG
jgi:hypothetical protein